MPFKLNQIFLSVILIVIVSTLVYHNALDNPFQYDDQVSIEENSYLRKAGVIRDIFTHPGYYVKITKPGTGHYRPIVFITFLLNYRLGGLNVMGYHLVNLAFHIGSAFMVFLIMEAMLGTPPLLSSPHKGGRNKVGGASPTPYSPLPTTRYLLPTTYYLLPTPYIPLASALIFAVHPFNSEVVNYITARSSVMSGFFYLLAFYCWVKFREQRSPPPFPPPRGGRGKRRGYPGTYYLLPTTYYYIASLLAFLLGMLTKEVVITLPIVLWLYDIYFNRASHPPLNPLPPITKGEGKLPPTPYPLPTIYYLPPTTRYLLNWRTYIPYIPFVFLVAMPYIFLRIFFMGAMFPTFKRNLITQLYTQLPVLAKYVRLLFLPLNLNIDHYVPIYNEPALPVIISALFLILCVGGAIWLYKSEKREWRVVSFFMIWFFIVLLPTTVIPLNAIMQENRGYLAAAGMAGILGIALGQAAAAARPMLRMGAPSLRSVNAAGVRYAIIGIALVSFSLATLYRNSLWGDRISLWSDAVSKSPLSARAHVNLGVSYAAKGMYRKGEKELLTALRADNPPLFDIYLNLGSIYHKTRRLDAALNEYQKASAIQPEDFRPHYSLGVLYQQKEDTGSAIIEYQRVMELNPDDFRTYHNMGLLYHNKGDYDTAMKYYKGALSLNPDYVKSAFNLAAIYERSGNADMAIREYLGVIKNDPGYGDAYYRLGDLYKKKGEIQRAEKFYREAQKIRNED